MTSRVIHLDFIKLSDSATPDQRTQLSAAAAALHEIEGVLGVGVIEGAPPSDYDLAVWFLLRDFLALEPFGTDTRYSRFLQREVAPVVQGFGGADVQVSKELVTSDGETACLALIGPEEAYDFEVREALELWANATGAEALEIGMAVGEKQVYRGAALAFGVTAPAERPDLEPFRGTLVQGIGRVLA